MTLNSQRKGNELVLLPSLNASLGPNGGFVMTEKFLEGAGRMAETWPGPVTALVEILNAPSTDFDLREVHRRSHAVNYEERPKDTFGVMHRLRSAAAVLGFPTRKQIKIASPCRDAGVPLIYVTEYTPNTEREIMRANTANPILRFRRSVWLARTEALRRNAFVQAAGLQCSGKPAFDLYREIQPRSMLFFDNRLSTAEVADDALCNDKISLLKKGLPLRLAFGGRFLPMKGVMDLPRLAASLLARGMDFTLDIFGDGPLKPQLESAISKLGVQQFVRLRDPMRFRDGWVPTLKNDIDVFVCTHVQGDPSSTYPEVLSSGVPMVGYANPAYQGVIQLSQTGWSVPIGDIEGLADLIIRLDNNRGELADAVVLGRDFGRRHAFEVTFRRRVEHIISVARL